MVFLEKHQLLQINIVRIKMKEKVYKLINVPYDETL